MSCRWAQKDKTPPSTAHHHQPHKSSMYSQRWWYGEWRRWRPKGLAAAGVWRRVDGGGVPLQRRTKARHSRSPMLGGSAACGAVYWWSSLAYRETARQRAPLAKRRGGRNTWQSDVMEWRGRRTTQTEQRDKDPGTGGRGQVSMITTVSRDSLIRPGPSQLLLSDKVSAMPCRRSAL